MTGPWRTGALVGGVLVLGGGCVLESPSEATPRILSVSPLSQKSNQSQVITVQLDTDPRLHVDYGTSSARMLALPELRLGDGVRIPLDTYLGHGQFLGVAGPLDYGDYPLQVSLGEGRPVAVSDATYSVKRAVSYSIDPVGPQVAGRPFTVTVRVDVKDELPFAGRARLQPYRDGTALQAPEDVGPLSEGENRQELTLLEPGMDYVVRITDDQDNDATSQSFAVADPTN